MQSTNFVERKGKISDLDRTFDVRFWQTQSPPTRFNAAWELVIHYARVKGLDVRQLRLHRSVETFQRQQRDEVDFDGLPLSFISRQDLITAKLASGRPQDILDANS